MQPIDRPQAPADLPILPLAVWYQMLRGYYFWDELPDTEIARLKREHAVLFADLQVYVQAHPGPRLKTTIAAWAAARGVALAEEV